MTHLLDSDSRDGRVLPLTPLHTHKQFVTTLRLPGEHPRHQRMSRPLRHVQAVPVQMVDTLSPALLLGCGVVSIAAGLVIAFATFQLMRLAFELVHRLIGGS